MKLKNKQNTSEYSRREVKNVYFFKNENKNFQDFLLPCDVIKKQNGGGTELMH